MKNQKINKSTLPQANLAKDGEKCMVKLFKSSRKLEDGTIKNKYSKPITVIYHAASLANKTNAYYELVSIKGKKRYIPFDKVLTSWVAGETPSPSKKEYIKKHPEARTYSSKDCSMLVKKGFCKTNQQARELLDVHKHLMKVPGYKERLDITVANRKQHKRIAELAKLRKCSFQQVMLTESMKQPGFKEKYNADIAKKKQARIEKLAAKRASKKSK